MLAVGLTVACGDQRAAVHGCGDDLGGVWSDGQRRWHALDMRGSVELYPMFDSAETAAQSAHALIFVRSPSGPLGHHVLWESGADQTSRVRHSATLDCADGRLEIAYEGTRLSLQLGDTLAPPTR